MGCKIIPSHAHEYNGLIPRGLNVIELYLADIVTHRIS